MSLVLATKLHISEQHHVVKDIFEKCADSNQISIFRKCIKPSSSVVQYKNFIKLGKDALWAPLSVFFEKIFRTTRGTTICILPTKRRKLVKNILAVYF